MICEFLSRPPRRTLDFIRAGSTGAPRGIPTRPRGSRTRSPRSRPASSSDGAGVPECVALLELLRTIVVAQNRPVPALGYTCSLQRPCQPARGAILLPTGRGQSNCALRTCCCSAHSPQRLVASTAWLRVIDAPSAVVIRYVTLHGRAVAPFSEASCVLLRG